jgi:hypothetical protein
MFPLYFKNEIALENAGKLINYINSHIDDFGELGENANRQTYWNGRTIFFEQIQDDEIKDIMRKQLEFTLNTLIKTAKIEKTLYPDTLSICRWPVGFELLPHADAEEPDGSTHIFNWRDFGTVTYLNEDFEDGTLYYPNKNIEIKPKTGYTAIHPGTLEYLHGVKKITKGTRYTIGTFLTYDKNNHRQF